MSSFTCPHFDLANDYCLLLKTDCVPGRKGCVLAGKSKFLVPAEDRIRQKEGDRKHKIKVTRPSRR
jgi:hypothetical protein